MLASHSLQTRIITYLRIRETSKLQPHKQSGVLTPQACRKHWFAEAKDSPQGLTPKVALPKRLSVVAVCRSCSKSKNKNKVNALHGVSGLLTEVIICEFCLAAGSWFESFLDRAWDATTPQKLDLWRKNFCLSCWGGCTNANAVC